MCRSHSCGDELTEVLSKLRRWVHCKEGFHQHNVMWWCAILPTCCLLYKWISHNIHCKTVVYGFNHQWWFVCVKWWFQCRPASFNPQFHYSRFLLTLPSYSFVSYFLHNHISSKQALHSKSINLPTVSSFDCPCIRFLTPNLSHLPPYYILQYNYIQGHIGRGFSRGSGNPWPFVNAMAIDINLNKIKRSGAKLQSRMG